jgi:hypothetical protein
LPMAYLLPSFGETIIKNEPFNFKKFQLSASTSAFCVIVSAGLACSLNPVNGSICLNARLAEIKFRPFQQVMDEITTGVGSKRLCHPEPERGVLFFKTDSSPSRLRLGMTRGRGSL